MPDFREKIQSSDFVKIVCVGDMQTSQPYTKPGWTDWLQRAFLDSGSVQTSWRRKVINAGIDRATPKHVTTYYSEYIGQYRPDVVLLSFGVSPLFPMFDEKVFSAELDQLLSTLEKNKIPVVLWTPYPLLLGEKRADTLLLCAQYKQKAVARGLQLVDLYHEFDDVELARVFTNKVVYGNELYSMEVGDSDIASLNNIGNYIVAKKIAKEVFNLSLPEKSVGTFEVPVLDTVKRWG